MKANPYSGDGSFAAAVSALPVGLRAMASTHYLDVSLALDDIGWHFLNFGEPNLVRETESGLRELGLVALARQFAEAHRVIRPFLRAYEDGQFSARLEPGKQAGDIYYEWLEETGADKIIHRLSKEVRAQDRPGEHPVGSFIYAAWVAYARFSPEKVFVK